MAKTIATKRVGAFDAMIEPNEDREGVDCWVVHRRTQASGSLALIENEGIVGIGEDEIDVPDKVATAISAWARNYGY